MHSSVGNVWVVIGSQQGQRNMEDLKGGKEQKEVELPSGCCEAKLLQKCEDTTKCRKGRC